MKRLKQIPLLVIFSCCLTAFAQTNQHAPTDSARAIVPFKQKNTTYWIDNFRQFRDALYKNDKLKAKEFFAFPILNEGNEIWYLAYSNNEKAIDKLPQTAKPFTDADFDKYFEKLFPKPLLKCFLKIKMEELYKTGKSESPEIKDSITTYKLYTSYDKASKTLELNFATNTPYKISATEYEPGESNYIYRFVVLKNGHIILKRILIAG